MPSRLEDHLTKLSDFIAGFTSPEYQRQRKGIGTGPPTLAPIKPGDYNADLTAGRAMNDALGRAVTDPRQIPTALIDALTYFGGGPGKVALEPRYAMGRRYNGYTGSKPRYGSRRYARPIPPRQSPNAWQGPILRRKPYVAQAPQNLADLVPWDLMRDRPSDPEQLFSRSRYDGPNGPYFHGTNALSLPIAPHLRYWGRDPNNIVGPGLYRTNDAPIAAGYARSTGTIWHTRAVRPQRLVPLDAPFDEAHPLYEAMHKFLTNPHNQLTRDPADTPNYRDFALEQLYNSAHPGRGVKRDPALTMATLLTPAKSELLSMESGGPLLGRTKQGNSRTMAALIPILRRMGYTGVEHTGGIQGGRKHNVQVHWNPFQDLQFQMASASPSATYELNFKRAKDPGHMEDFIMWGYDPLALQKTPVGTVVNHPISNRAYVRTKLGLKPVK